MRKTMTAAVLAMLVAAACSQEPPTGVSNDELVLAQGAQQIAETAALGGECTHVWWLRRVLDTLRTTDDSAALADLAQARAYHDSARAAFARGDTAAAREFRRLAFRAVLSAVIDLFPNAPERVGLCVDATIVKIETFLGTRDAPRIRAVLAHVKELRAQADSAFVAGDKVTALALNLRSAQILHRLVEHIRYLHHDHDGIADREMEDDTGS